MNTSPTTMLSKPTGDERVPKGTFGYFHTRNRHRLYTLIVQEFKRSGLTQAQLSRRLGKKPEIVCRLLATPGNLRADTFSDLLFAISGAVPAYRLNYPLEQPPLNDTRPDWLNQLQDSKNSVDRPAAKIQESAFSTMLGGATAMEANIRSVRSSSANWDTSSRSERAFLSAARQQPPNELIQ